MFSASVADLVDFWPDPDPDQNICLAKLLLEIFLMEMCSKKYIHELKVKQERFLKYWLLLQAPKRWYRVICLDQDPDPVTDVLVRIRPDPQNCESLHCQQGPRLSCFTQSILCWFFDRVQTESQNSIECFGGLMCIVHCAMYVSALSSLPKILRCKGLFAVKYLCKYFLFYTCGTSVTEFFWLSAR
jgi:hypothetical protein